MPQGDYLLDELEEMFDRIDESGDRRIGFDEFRGLMLEIGDSRYDCALRSCFDRIDLNHDGTVSFQELRAWWPNRHSTGL